MRALCLGVAMGLASATHPALAQSEWLESGRITATQIAALCKRVSDVRLLARMQMISVGGERWRRLSRRELVIEAAVMGVPPLNPDRCYVIARAGRDNESERRAFEVRDFAVSPERTSVLLIGQGYEPPPDATRFGR